MKATPPASSINAADCWERARQSERGIALYFADEVAAFRAKMNLYAFRAKARKRAGGVSLYDGYTLAPANLGEASPHPDRPWVLKIQVAGEGELPTSAILEEL